MQAEQQWSSSSSAGGTRWPACAGQGGALCRRRAWSSPSTATLRRSRRATLQPMSRTAYTMGILSMPATPPCWLGEACSQVLPPALHTHAAQSTLMLTSYSGSASNGLRCCVLAVHHFWHLVSSFVFGLQHLGTCGPPGHMSAVENSQTGAPALSARMHAAAAP